MSYQVLARKWRPKTFQDLIGQEAVARTLMNSLKDKRVHPALIFAGPRGTGKTSTARILAKTLNCLHKKNFISCGQCKTCKDIEVSRSLDVMEIDGASNNGVEAVRQMKETISYLPTGPFKIYIIDEVHMLSGSAFNALLKTLEEPPPHVIFIMATTEMRKIPSTVLSRCQILQFQQIADSLIHSQLKKICQQEKIEVSEEALWMLVRESMGSLRDAQGLLDQMIAFSQNKFDTKEVGEILGLTDRSLLMESIESLLQKDPSKMLEVLFGLHNKGAEPSLFLQHLIRELRNLILLKLDSPSIHPMIPLSTEEKTQLKKWIKLISLEDLHLLFDMALKASMEIPRVQDTKVFLEMWLLKMSQAPHIESLFLSSSADHQQIEQKEPPKDSNDKKQKSVLQNPLGTRRNDSDSHKLSTEKEFPLQTKQLKGEMPISALSTDIRKRRFAEKEQDIFRSDILDL